MNLERFLLDTPGLTYREALNQLERESSLCANDKPAESGEIIGHLAETYRRLGNLSASIDHFGDPIRY